MQRKRLAAICTTTMVALTLTASPGCITYSAMHHSKEKHKPVPDLGQAFLIGNVVGGAIVGAEFASQAATGDAGVAFLQGMAAWTLLDLLAGGSLFLLDELGALPDE